MAERKNSEKRIATNNRWTNAHYDRINIAVPKGQKEIIQTHAEAHGQSANGFINRAINETMARDKAAQEATGGPTEAKEAAEE